MKIWPDPILTQKYRITKEVDKGRVGTCYDTRESDFGMKWAFIQFDEAGVDQNQNGWFRTVFIEPALT